MADEATAAAEEVEADLQPDLTEESETESEDVDQVDDQSEESETDEEADSSEDDSQSEESDESEEDPAERNRKGYAERQAVRRQVTQLVDNSAEPFTAADLIEQGVDPALAEIEALKADIQRKEVIQNITELNTGLVGDATQVVRDFPVFDEKSKEYDPSFAKEVEDLYKEASQLVTDPNSGLVLQANVPLYKFYQAAAKWRGAGAVQATARGQKAAERQLAAADPGPSSSATKSQPDDPFLRGLTGKV